MDVRSCMEDRDHRREAQLRCSASRSSQCALSRARLKTSFFLLTLTYMEVGVPETLTFP